jgi:hypothetical protein
MNAMISVNIIRRAGVFTAAALVAVALTGIAPAGASASTCAAWTGVQPPNPGTSSNELNGVAVLSSCNAWAVGGYSSGSGGQTLILHWNGAVWQQVTSPNPAFGNVLVGVAAISATNIWAVGTSSPPTGAEQTLILHWNGTVWQQVASPSPSSAGNFLIGVAATSASNAWAVGYFFTGTGGTNTLIEHWNGTAWRRVTSPSVADGFIAGVTATSASNTWAVGGGQFGGPPFILHWNGAAWRRVVISGAGQGDVLNGVAATSSRNAWAVGTLSAEVSPQTLTLHWNGTAWKRVTSPNPSPGGASGSFLQGVAATSASNAWAVGFSFNGIYQTIIEHWNGTAWRLVASPNPSSTRNVLNGVAATSASNAWAVGSYDSGTVRQTFALHCC